MSERSGWRPLREPDKAAGDAFVLSPFARLARAHALAVATDTLVAMALAGSLFFSIPTGEARGRVALYLLLTMAPFAVVSPLIGPAIDRARGGRRGMVIASAALRSVVCAFMIDDVDTAWLFVEAFLVLVLSKAYIVAKSALVPTVVKTDAELVEANSKLSLLGGVVGFAVALPGIIALKLIGPEAVLVLAVATSAAGAVAGTRLPAVQVAAQPAGAAERAELRGSGIVLAASAMGILRGIVGFLTFLLAFDLRGGSGRQPIGSAVGRAAHDALGFSGGNGGGRPAWHFGVVLGASVVGSLLGAVVAPRARKSMREEQMLLSVLALTIAGGLFGIYRGGLFGASVVAGVVGIAASAGKLAFDSLVQRDAPDANRGRSFARFETRFQVAWVVGAVIPVVIHLPARLGYAALAGAAGFAAFTYLGGLQAARRRVGRAPSPRKVDAGQPQTGRVDLGRSG